jgi:HEPN domain-containing protein
MSDEELIKYWIKSSDQDFLAMGHLMEKGDYVWALFIGHLVIEKLIKGCYVKNISGIPPFIHDLIRLAEKANLELDEQQKDLMDTISAFNLQARYDDYKMEFYNKCSKDFAEKWYDTIKGLREWIRSKLVI